MESKSIFQSKTVWANVASVLAVVAARFGLELSPDDALALATGLLTAVNLVMRLVTKQPVHLVKGE